LQQLESLLRYLHPRLAPKEYFLAFDDAPMLYYLTARARADRNVTSQEWPIPATGAAARHRPHDGAGIARRATRCGS